MVMFFIPENLVGEPHLYSQEVTFLCVLQILRVVDWIVFLGTRDNVTLFIWFSYKANKDTVGRGSSQTLYFVTIQGYIEASTQTTYI